MVTKNPPAREVESLSYTEDGSCVPTNASFHELASKDVADHDPPSAPFLNVASPDVSNSPFKRALHYPPVFQNEFDQAGTDLYSLLPHSIETAQAHLRVPPKDLDEPLALPSSQEIIWERIHYGKRRAYSLGDSSESCSYANSVLSTASLASSATDLSKHSGYSAMQIARATQELILVLQDDINLVPLYRRAIADSSIGPEKLERNLRRLFRNYAELLGQAAGDTLEHLASRLVKTKARAVAQAIIQKYGTIYHGMRQTNSREEEQSSDEETNAQPVDESLFEDLVIFREFLIGSEAFETLHAQIRSFILPKSERKEVTDVVREAREATPPEELEPAVTDLKTASHPPKSAREDIVDVATKDGEAFDIPTRDREACDTNATYDKEHIVNGTNMIKPVSPHQTLADRVRPTISDAMIAIGYLEPPLRPGYNRLRWQCVSRVRTLALDQYDSFLYKS